MPPTYLITVVDFYRNWRKVTAPALVRDGVAPPSVALRWAKVRRSMSAAGLKRKLKDQRN